MSIDNNIRADLFRNRIEDKNTLNATGAIYVGTGKKTEILGAGTAGATGVYYGSTGVAPSGEREIPISVVDGNGTVRGLEFKSVETILSETGIEIRDQKGLSITAVTGPINLKGLSITVSGTTVSVLGESVMLTGQSFLINGTSALTVSGPSINIDGTSVKVGNPSTPETEVVINGATQGLTTIYGLNEASLSVYLTNKVYYAPSGTPALFLSGSYYVSGTYVTGTYVDNLIPIVYNIGKRLDSAEKRINILGL